jgi:hypothetical protein
MLLPPVARSMTEPLAILNGFGLSLGDGIVGLQALHTARALGAVGETVLHRRQPEQAMVRQLYALARDFTALDVLAARPRGRVLDIRDFAFDPSFRGVAMIDWFLARLGLDPAGVPAAMKRNAWLAPRVALPARGAPYVLVCPDAAIRLRRMPEPVHGAILDWLGAHAGMPVRTQRGAPRCATIAELCALVAGAACIVATDTAMVHLADAFAVPCLAFFTTHDPAWRVRDYPLCTPLRLRPRLLPDALEFARSDADLRATEAAWFPEGADLSWISHALAAWFAQRGAISRYSAA